MSRLNRKTIAGIALALALALSITACGAKKPTAAKQDTKPATVTEQTTDSKDNAVVHVESAKITDAIRYPQVTEAPGELIMEYMNQSLEAPAAALQEMQGEREMSYEVKRNDNEMLSVLYTQTVKGEDGKEVKTLIPVNLQVSTGVEVTMDNAFNDVAAVKKLLGEDAAKAENLQFYLTDDGAVFFYRAADDQEYKTVEVGNDALAQYWNESFGEKPAS